MKAFLPLAIVISLGLGGPAFAEKRVALVIGNSAYQNVTPLENPANDAVLMAETLKDLGFSITGDHAQLNLDKRALDDAIQSFGKQVQGADVALFYYAGHGVQVRGSNYLVPVSANPSREADVDFQMVDVSLVLNQMQGSGTRLNMVILDACRNNPFGGRGLRSSNGGLAQLQAPDGTLISYATQPGNVAQDGSDGHSPYTAALAATLKRPGSDLFQTFNAVGLTVKRSTGGAQQPWVSSSPIDGNFYFAGPQASASTDDIAAPQGPLKEPTEQVATLAAPPKSLPGADLITDCDRLAASNFDPQRPKSLAGVKFLEVDGTRAAPACNQALHQYADVPRFIFQAGRVAQVQKDYASARQLYEKAASAGYVASYIGIGLIYFQGLGVPQDYNEARSWYEKAAAANDPVAFNAIGFMYETGHGASKDYAEAKKWYEKAAAAGVTVASVNLGRLYEEGNGVTMDPGRARSLFESAANAGEPAGMRALGNLYDRGIGEPQDFAQARKWYEKGAAGGDATAMNGLGLLYDMGHGVTQDFAEARKWYEKGAALGQLNSLANLGNMYQFGRGVAKDYTQARAYYEKSAAGGRTFAMIRLGDLYLQGLGVTKDPVRARKWYEMAQAAGDPAAAKAISQMDNPPQNSGGTKQNSGGTKKGR